MKPELTVEDQDQIEEILERRAIEICGFLNDYKSEKNYYGSVELALAREIERLRSLASKIKPFVEEEFE